LTPNAWVSVRRSALRHTVQALRAELAGVEIIAVVKANAFGHGAEAALVFQSEGIDFFAVTTPAEALELRQAGIQGRILVFLPPLPGQYEELIAIGCDLTVCDDMGVDVCTEAAQKTGQTARVHLKVDTGMGRLGALPNEALNLARKIAASSLLEFAGIYTHFARALEPDPGPTRRQFETFQKVLAQLEANGINVGLRHCANSAATLRFPEMRLDAVRPGTILYGQYPSASVPRTVKLEDGWSVKARIVSVRDVPMGTAVGYGGEWVARRPSKLAVLPIGYADGFTVAPASATSGMRGLKQLLKGLTGRGASTTVTVRDSRAPVVGRVSMQICTIDVTDTPGVAVGDIVTVPMRRITASVRLPRIYED